MRVFAIVMMSLLLAGGAQATAAKKPTAQQAKMSACAKESKGKKGDEYRQAMSACLSR